MDPARARALYVSNDPADHARNTDFKADMAQEAAIDARYEKASTCGRTMDRSVKP